MKATPCLSTQIYGAEMEGGTDSEREMEGRSDRNGNEGREPGEEAEAWEGEEEERRGYLVRGHR